MAPQQVPRPNSSAAEVRDYIATTLHNRYDVPEDEAKAVASAWKYGRGMEFWTYDLQTFRDLFGSEVGMLLYTHSSKVGQGRQQPIEKRKDMFGLPPCIFMLYGSLFATVLCAWLALNSWLPVASPSQQNTFFTIVSMSSGVTFFILYLCLYT